MPIRQDSAPSRGLFKAIVINANAASHAVTVIRKDQGAGKGLEGGNMIQGILILPALTRFLGFSESILPQPGSTVLCLDDSINSCYILGVLPDARQEKNVNMPSRSMLGAGSPREDEAHCKGHVKYTPSVVDMRRPTDLVSGDWGMSNEFGVLLALHQQMVQVKGSDLAQIQCHLLDDLVRIISHNFQHFTALGEFQVFHDGKDLCAEFGVTHKSAETYGHPAVSSDTPNTPPFEEDGGDPSVDDVTDFYGISGDERKQAIARFKGYIGSLGDFIRLVLTRPDPDELRSLDPDKKVEKPDLGLFDLHLGTNGAFHLRSLQEIFLEKSNWIRVPHRLVSPDDPKGDDASKLQYDKKEKFEFDDTYRKHGNPFLYFLQLRDYVAYTHEKLGYQKFKKHEKDFHVNDDKTKETKIADVQQIDQETPGEQANYERRSSGMYHMPNGGLVFRDAFGSAIVMEGGNIYLQPANDLVLQPLRNLVGKVGGNTSIATNKQVDISSTVGGVRVKADKAVYLYSQNSGIVVEAGGETSSAGNGESLDAIDDISGVVLKSKMGILTYSEGDVTIFSKAGVKLHGKDIDVTGTGVLSILSKDQIFINADNYLQTFSGGDTWFMSEGSLGLAGATNTILGHKDQEIAITYPEGTTFAAFPYGILEVSKFEEVVKQIKDNKEDVLQYSVFKDTDTLDLLKFKFPASHQYGNLQSDKDGIPMTMAQQEELARDGQELLAWEEKQVNETYPYPGADLFKTAYYSCEKPENIKKEDDSSDLVAKADPVARPAKITLESLLDYKIVRS